MAKVKLTASRFGIGEWYGRSFVRMTAAERREIAQVALAHKKHQPPCPFKGGSCVKNGGVCSIRLYDHLGGGLGAPAEGQEGDLRVTCPHRFKQDEIIYRAVGGKLLGTPRPRRVSEVRFLKKAVGPGEEAKKREEVGNIDDVLVAEDSTSLWCAVELQAVYFSGTKMSALFTHIRGHPSDDLPFPDLVRRPDYRSSGPKRLMPQLQIKVPTLRRWGKKMAVIVDEAFYRNQGVMENTDSISNCDIAWFSVSFDERHDPARLVVGEPKLQTLEQAVKGLTGGEPVTLEEFERKIRAKLRGS